ncbi:MAG: element excision factor XisH family protein [Pirellulaceae bacterium]
MPAKNIYHVVVIEALEADGWTITDDPLKMRYGGRDFYVDLGAERTPIGAEKGERKIAVEIQSFLNQSIVRDIEEAVGQYDVYRTLLQENEPKRSLYLAVPQRIRKALLVEPFGRLIVAKLNLSVIVFNEQKKRIIEWTS